MKLVAFLDEMFSHVTVSSHGYSYDRITVFGRYLYCTPLELIMAVIFALVIAGVVAVIVSDVCNMFRDIREQELEEEPEPVVYTIIEKSLEFGDMVYDAGTRSVGYYLTDILGEDNNIYALCCRSMRNTLDVYHCPKFALAVVIEN